MRDLVVNLVASVVAGVAVWLGQRGRRYRRLARMRAFFGVVAGTDCVLVVARHWSSQSELSVHRRDVAALVELAAIVRDCGGRPVPVAADSVVAGFGRLAEFCVGGPTVNPRMAAHLRAVLPGVRLELGGSGDRAMTWWVGATPFRRKPERSEYVVLAKAYGPASTCPVILIAGQTASTNLAAARFLGSRYRRLSREYGVSGRFCLVLRVVEPATYGPDFVEVAADVTDVAFRAPEQPGPREEAFRPG